MKVEESQRLGNSISIYDSRKNIAAYFENMKLYNVAVSYYNEALDIALKSGAVPLVEMEAMLNLGRAMEQNGNLSTALDLFERSRSIALSKNNTEQEELASKGLINVYLKIAESLESTSNYQQAINNYLQCKKILENSDENSLLDIDFRLGKAYKEIKDISTAIKYLEKFLAGSKQLRDKKKEGFAQAALASCYEQSGNIQLAANYLKNYVDMAEADPTARLSEALALNQLGMLHSKMEQYPVSVKYFKKFYDLSAELGTEIDKNLLDEAAVKLGIASGNAQMNIFFEHVIKTPVHPGLLEWKASRSFTTLK
jgi:tetratricopeptide (TPR) repeat protein